MREHHSKPHLIEWLGVIPSLLLGPLPQSVQLTVQLVEWACFDFDFDFDLEGGSEVKVKEEVKEEVKVKIGSIGPIGSIGSIVEVET